MQYCDRKRNETRDFLHLIVIDFVMHIVMKNLKGVFFGISIREIRIILLLFFPHERYEKSEVTLPRVLLYVENTISVNVCDTSKVKKKFF